MAMEVDQPERQATADASADLSFASFVLGLAGDPYRSASQRWLYAYFAMNYAALALNRFGLPHQNHGGTDDKVMLALRQLPEMGALAPPPRPPVSRWMCSGIRGNPDSKRATRAARLSLTYANAFIQKTHIWFASHHPEVIAIANPEHAANAQAPLSQ